MKYADLINKPFIDGGRGPDGYDCWGLVREVYRRHGIFLPDYSISATACERISKQMIDSRSEWIKLAAPEVPCLVAFKADLSFVQHMGAYIGYGKFLHTRDYGVCVERLRSPLWNPRIRGFYQYAG